MSFWVWFLIALCFFVYVTILFIKKAKQKEQSLWKTVKEWLINIVDVFSGGF
jgi:hypothetical protein